MVQGTVETRESRNGRRKPVSPLGACRLPVHSVSLSQRLPGRLDGAEDSVFRLAVCLKRRCYAESPVSQHDLHLHQSAADDLRTKRFLLGWRERGAEEGL